MEKGLKGQSTTLHALKSSNVKHSMTDNGLRYGVGILRLSRKQRKVSSATCHIHSLHILKIRKTAHKCLSISKGLNLYVPMNRANIF